MALSDREERIVRRLEQQFRFERPYLDRHRWRGLALASLGYVAGFLAALALMVTVVAALVGFVVFLALSLLLLRHIDWRRRAEQLRDHYTTVNQTDR